LGLEVLAKKGSKEILCALAASKVGMNFTELKELIGSPTTASQRLQELTKLGMLKRGVQADRFRSVRYSLTEKGAQAVRLMKELEKLI
jgi:DNA-binding HxlR family transcriptional regulator